VKILYHHRVGSKDGQAVHIEELIAALKRRGHVITLVAPPAAAEQDFGADAGFVDTLKRLLPKPVYEILELGYSVVAYRRLARAWADVRPDAFYERYNLYLLAGVWLRRRKRIPMILEVNAPLMLERRKNNGLGLPWLARWVEGATWRGADMVAPVTQALAEHVRRAGVPDERIVVIPNGIDPQHFGPHVDGAPVRARHGLEGRLVLGFTGFMRPWHGLDRVIRFLAAHGKAANLHALLVGDGPARPELERLAAELGVADRVTFPGIVDRDAIAAHVAAFDVALQPDVTDYASPLKLFEYMGLAKAVVAPARANIREVLQDAGNALLFDPDREGSFEEALSRMVADEGLRRRLGEAALQTVRDRRLTWDGNAERVETLFRKLGARD
jgi:glycosyltransferase involved in cell wall biosynthesis